jgi:hypothetical protein
MGTYEWPVLQKVREYAEIEPQPAILTGTVGSSCDGNYAERRAFEAANNAERSTINLDNGLVRLQAWGPAVLMGPPDGDIHSVVGILAGRICRGTNPLPLS